MRFIILFLATFVCSFATAAVNFDATKSYYIKNISTSLYLGLQTGHSETNVVNATPIDDTPVPFVITGSGDKFVIRSGDLYMGLSQADRFSGWNTASYTTEQPVWTILETEKPNQYRIKSSKGWLKFDGNNEYAYTDGEENNQSLWEIAEYSEGGQSLEFQLPITGSSADVSYLLRHEESGLYVTFGTSGSNATLTDSGTPLAFVANGTGFSIKSATENKYLGASTWNANVSTTPIPWTFAEQGDGCIVLSQTSSRNTGQLGCDNLENDIKLYCNKTSNTHFRVERATSPASTITSGKYYRLRNHFEPERYITASLGALYAYPASDEIFDQVWLITAEGSSWVLRNALTNQCVRATKRNSAYALGANGAPMTLTDTGTDENGQHYFMIAPVAVPTGYFNNSKSAQSFKIVSWAEEDDDSSWWYAEEMLITEDDIARIATLRAEMAERQAIIDNADAYAEALGTFFADNACTQLKAPYASMSDAALNTAIGSTLPDDLKAMAVNVRNDRWDADATRSSYVKRFRIANYEVYSDPAEWGKITNVGPFGVLTNPTGITVEKGQLLYVMVSDAPADESATLQLGIVVDTESTPAQTFDLVPGLNILMAHDSGECFVLYTLTDTERLLADYAPITVHIEGGEATGCWDLNRGMTNDDWTWLCDNMFTAPFLHVKGRSTVLNVLTDNVRGAANPEGIMKIWDFIFDTEERLVGNDGQWDGRYRPVINPRHSYKGNPNWGGRYSTNHPNISKDYLFNFDKMVNDVGHLWEIYHEEAHAHQYPINMAATTESSNNGYAHMTNYEFGSYNSRNKGVETLINFKNNGWGWVDILRGGEGTSRANNFTYYDDALWLQSHLFFQLYLYFHVQGHMPDFWPRLADKMRNTPLVKHGNDPNNPTLYYEDYLRFAEACAEVSQTDLYEFFDTWGFFGYYDEVKVGNEYEGFSSKDNAAAGIRFVGDYGTYYLKMPVRGNADDEARLAALKAKMQAMPRKAPGLIFIDDHIRQQYVSDTCFIARPDIAPERIGTPIKYYGVTPGTSGDFGMFTDFDGVNRTAGIDFSSSGSTVSIAGSGLLGVKVYGPDGRIAYLANTRSFTPSDAVRRGILDGTYRLVVVCGDDTEMPILHGDFSDVDGDGKVTIRDVALLISYLPHSKAYGSTHVDRLRDRTLDK